MPLSENQRVKLEFETLRSRIGTRESSTLTFSAVTTSASFVILSLLVTNETMPQVMYYLGPLFPLIGIIYRELTIFSIDYVEGNKLKELELELTGRNIPRPHWATYIVRRLLIRAYLYLGFFAWPLLLVPAYFLPLIMVTIITPVATTIIHYVMERKDELRLNRNAATVAALVLFLLVPLIILGLAVSLFIPVYLQSSNVTSTRINITHESSPPLGYANLELSFAKQDLQNPQYDLILELQAACNQRPSVIYAFQELEPELGNYSITKLPMQRNDMLGVSVQSSSFNASYLSWEAQLEVIMYLEKYEPTSFPLDVYETPKIIVAVNAEGSNSTHKFIMKGYNLTSNIPSSFSATISDYRELSENETMAELGNRSDLLNSSAFQFRVTFLRNTQSLPLLFVYLLGPSLGIWCMFSVTQFNCNNSNERIKIFAGALLATFGYLITFRNFAPPTLTWTEISIITVMGAWAFLEMIRALIHVMRREPEKPTISN